MLATGSGLCFEHVSRMGSVLTAVQRTRQCSTIITESIYIFSLYHPRDTPTDPGVQYRGPTTRNRPGVGGRASRAFVGVSVAGKGLTLDLFMNMNSQPLPRFMNMNSSSSQDS